MPQSVITAQLLRQGRAALDAEAHQRPPAGPRAGRTGPNRSRRITATRTLAHRARVLVARPI